MSQLSRSFLASVLLMAMAATVHAQSEIKLCDLDTDVPVRQPRDFKVVELDAKGNGNKKAEISSSKLTSKSELQIQVDEQNDIAQITLYGAAIPTGKLVDPGVALQVSEGPMNFDLIRLVAQRTPDGYTLKVTTLASGGLIHSSYRSDVWKVVKNKEGAWGLQYISPEKETVASSGEPRFAESLTAILTLKDPKNDAKGFKGISAYKMEPKAKLSSDLAHSSDPRILAGLDKRQSEESGPGFQADDYGESVSLLAR